ncbi:NIF-domain-containing protein [Lentinus brumalis]|uniref:NIF-domain-containing protein n=1 Tax=Lentinus brumalis TaxID=2498619 RepID=A0A371DM63_9APHY|nr:NIF-domain-containing protein [Polyporus brumalis]
MGAEWLRQFRSRYARPWSQPQRTVDCLHQPSLRPSSSSSHLLALVLPILLEAALFGVGLTPMNSLSYLSRQFDVLASPRTPPSTPATEHSSFAFSGERHTRLKRSGSTRSFQVPQPSTSSAGSFLKRSYSSPAEVNPSILAAASSLLAPALSRKPSPSRPSSRRPSVSATEKGQAIRPKSGDWSPFRHLLFVRIILQLWHAFLVTLRSFARPAAAPGLPVEDTAVDENSDEEEKDTEDESRDEKSPPPSVLLDSSQPPPYQPAIPSPLSQPDTSSPLSQSPSPPLSKPPPPLPAGTVSEKPFSLSLSISDSKSVSTTLTPPATRARSVTPTPPAKQTPFHQQKTLVLDLDETLIHSTSRPIPSAGGSGLLGFGGRNKGAGYTVEVVLGGRSTLYHVYKRPFVDYFLRKVSQWYTLVIFTASMQEYADPVIDWLDAGRGILGRRLFRESCTQLPNGSYTKDLSIVDQDLSRVCLIDNSPVCYVINEANGIPIEGWTHDPHDEALLDLLPVLDSLRFTSDVRRVLGIRGFS